MGDGGKQKSINAKRDGGGKQVKLGLPLWPSVIPKNSLRFTQLNGPDLFLVILSYSSDFPKTETLNIACSNSYKIHEFFSSTEATQFIKVAEKIGFSHQGSLGPSKGEAYRDNGRISISDPIIANQIWESGLREPFTDIKIRGKIAVALNPNIRLYRYSVGQRFGPHIDESVSLDGGKCTLYTLLVYLNGSKESQLKGGETVFYGARNRIVADVAPVEGMALLHIHGDKCLLHESRVVIKGVKYVFRSDVVFA